jgi:acetyl-CoA carboxylase biotin carboxyl carrier protein
MNFEADYIKKIAKILSDCDLTEINLTSGNDNLVIKRDKEVAYTTVSPEVVAVSAQPSVTVPQQQAVIPAPSTEVKAVEQEKGVPITSPMVGTFYAAPSSEDLPFVKVGDTISKGQVVCIVEAMKLMNKIESDVAGKVVKICVENGKPVEYGQVLMYVE